jgi:ankyrin repeat protein
MMRILALLPFFALLIGCGRWGFSYGNGKDLRTPLEKAAQEGDLEAVKRLLASGIDPNDGGMFGAPLNSAVLRKDNVEVIRALVAAGANPNGRSQDGAGCWAARALLESGASIKPPKCSRLVVG